MPKMLTKALRYMSPAKTIFEKGQSITDAEWKKLPENDQALFTEKPEAAVSTNGKDDEEKK